MLWYFYSLWQKNTSYHTANWLAFLAVVSVLKVFHPLGTLSTFFIGTAAEILTSPVFVQQHTAQVLLHAHLFITARKSILNVISCLKKPTVFLKQLSVLVKPDSQHRFFLPEVPQHSLHWRPQESNQQPFRCVHTLSCPGSLSFNK